MNTSTEHPATLSNAQANGTLSDRVRGLRLPTASEGGNRTTWLPWTLCLLLGVSTGVLAWKAFAPGQGAAASGKPADAAASGTKTGEVAASGDVALEAKGNIIPAHQIQVSPKVSGMVEELYIEEGRQFKQGETLAVLEKQNYQYAVDRARANLERARAQMEAARQRRDELQAGNRPEEIAAAKASLGEAEAQRDQLLLEWKRNRELKTGNALAAREYEQAEYAYKAMDQRAAKLRQDFELMAKGAREERRAAAAAELRQAEADVSHAEADLLTAQWNYDNCTVRAPVTGTILIKRAEKGNLVQPMAFSGSTSLCDMADLSDLEVELSIQERDIANVKVGQKCRIRPEAFQQRVYEGQVDRLMPIADRSKGAITVRAKVVLPKEEAQGTYLKPEMSVIVSFLKEQASNKK